MAEQDGEEKSHEPSQKRLDDARTKGQIARSHDLTSAVALAGFTLGAVAFGPAALRQSGQQARAFLGDPTGIPVIPTVTATLLPLAGLLIFPLIPVLVLLSAQRGILFTTDNLMPKLSRIDPIAGARRRFGAEGLVDFAKGLAKLALISLLVLYLLRGRADTVLASATFGSGPFTAFLLVLMRDLMVGCAVLALALGLVDLLFQLHQHRRRNRMSQQEMRDEHREVEGDPHARAERRQRGKEIALNRMLTDVPKADVVIVNPTHYAVALKWTRGSGRAPVCLAKGTDEVASRIRAIAAENGIPLHSDPPTARAIHATVEIGQSIRPDHYRAVAAALRFSEAMRRKARQRG